MIRARRSIRNGRPRGNFLNREEGLALTEYLILLGLLTAGSITAVVAIGGSLTNSWTGWARWYDSSLGKIAAGPATGGDAEAGQDPGNVPEGVPTDGEGEAEGGQEPQTPEGNDVGSPEDEPDETGQKDKNDPKGQTVRSDGKGKADKKSPDGQAIRAEGAD